MLTPPSVLAAPGIILWELSLLDISRDHAGVGLQEGDLITSWRVLARHGCQGPHYLHAECAVRLRPRPPDLYGKRKPQTESPADPVTRKLCSCKEFNFSCRKRETLLFTIGRPHWQLEFEFRNENPVSFVGVGVQPWKLQHKKSQTAVLGHMARQTCHQFQKVVRETHLCSISKRSQNKPKQTREQNLWSQISKAVKLPAPA